MASPAAVLNILLTANTVQANAALSKTQAQLVGTGKTATATSATVKKAMLGIGVAAVGAAGALYKIGEEFDDAYDKIRVGTGATGKELKKLKGSFREVVQDVPASFEDASTAIADLNSRMGLTGKPLERMTKQVTELSRITKTDVSGNVESVSEAFVDWEVRTKDMGKTLDGFFRVSQKSGASVGEMTDAVQKFGSPLRQLGFDLDEAASMWATFVRAGVNTQTMVPGLKLALASLNAPTDDLRAKMEDLGIAIGKPEEGIQRVFDLLGNQSNLSQIEKTTLAMEVFGKRAGADMAEAIKQGRFEVDEMLDVFRNGEDTIRKAGKDTMDLGEQLQQFSNILKVRLEPVAEDVFTGLGDLMKEVTKEFKRNGLAGVLDLLIKKLGDAVPKIVEAGTKIGAKLAGAILRGFANSPVLSKLFVAGGIVGYFGGKAALDKAGVVVGKSLGKGLGKGVVIGLAIALPAIGIEIGNWIREHKGQIINFGKKLGELFVNGMIDAVNFGIRQINEAMDKANVFSALGVDAPNIGEIGKVDFTSVDKAVVSLNHLIEKLDGAKKAGKGFGEGYSKAVKSAADASDKQIGSRAVGSLLDLQDRSVKTGKGVKNDLRGTANELGKNSKDFDRWSDSAGKDLDRTGDSTRDLGKRGSKNFDGLRKVVDNLGGAWSKGLDLIGGNTKNLLDKLKVDFDYNIKKGGKSSPIDKGAGFFQRGGPINLGAPSGDTVPAMLERGEYVLNRNAVSKLGKQNLDAINFGAAPRFQKGGGLDFALGPYDIPPIQYAADHAGGNSHVHVTGTSTSWVVGLGKKLQQMGFMVGEHPAFGGVNAQHSATGGHYDALAIDINSAADETQAEVGKIAQLLGGSFSGATEKIKRLILDGPKGPLRSGGQSALDMTRDAANKLIKKQQAASMSHSGFGNISASGSGNAANRALGKQMMLTMFGANQWPYLDHLWGVDEGHWDENLANMAGSGAYGIAQALPASKYPPAGQPSAPPGIDKAKAQIGWGLNYIKERYGDPAAADAFRHNVGWYRAGGLVQFLAGGGGVKPGKKGKGGPKFTGSMPAWKPDGSKMTLGEPWKTAEKMQAVLSSIGLWDERIGIASANAGIDGLFTGNERTHAINLNVELLKKLSAARDFAKAGLTKGMTMLGRKSTPGWQKSMLEELVPTFLETLKEMQGATGKGGRIFETFAEIAGLQGREVDVPAVPDSALGGFNALGAAKGLASVLQERLDEVAVWDERIRIAQLMADLDGVVTESERKEQITLNQALLDSLYGVRSGAKRGFNFVNKSLPKAVGANQSGLLELRDTFLTALTGAEGLTGKSGRLLETKLVLQGLGMRTDTGSTAPDQSQLLGLKLDDAMATIRRLNVGIAQNAVFQGSFADGGRIPGPGYALVGERGPELISTRGGETVTPNHKLGTDVRVVIEDNRTRVLIDGQEVEAIVDRKLNTVARNRSYAGAGRL